MSFLLEAGARLDRYDLLYEVGRGGMGSVWAARLRGKHGFEKLVAIKTILPEFAREPRFRDLLLNEARLTAKIEHPNVVQTFELGEHQGALYVVMEWIDGESLDVLQKVLSASGAVIPLGVGLRIIADVCAGLHAAHELRDDDGRLMSIIHSDISPHNILVNTRGMTKLADFGIAKIHDRVMGQSQEMPSLRGKMRYMAPERVSGQAEDRRADLWSLGMVLQELLPKDVPAVCHRIVQRALAPARERRFPTALDFARAIESAMSDCSLTTTSAEVASFFGPILRERSAERRQKLETTLMMDATLDVGRDLKPATSTVRIDAVAELTMPMNRTLFFESVAKAPRRRLGRLKWWQPVGAAGILAGLALVGWFVLVPVRPSVSTSAAPDSTDASGTSPAPPASERLAPPPPARDVSAAPTAEVSAKAPPAKPAPERKPRRTPPAVVPSAPAKPDPFDSRP